MFESLIITTNTSGYPCKGFCWPVERAEALVGKYVVWGTVCSWHIYCSVEWRIRNRGCRLLFDGKYKRPTFNSWAEQKISVAGLAWNFLGRGLLFSDNPRSSFLLQLFVKVWEEESEMDHNNKAEEVLQEQSLLRLYVPYLEFSMWIDILKAADEMSQRSRTILQKRKVMTTDQWW